MTIKIHFIAFIAGILLLTAGCTKYLDVKPEAAYTENQVFQNEPAIQQALNGLYIDLADNNLYGAALTNTTIELMGQRYYTQGGSDLFYESFQNYQYQQTYVQTAFDNLWNKAYATILAANIFIKKIDGAMNSNVVSAAHGKSLKGEAIAIRAMLHFDLLRLFGPSHTVGSLQAAIPYYTDADGKAQPILNSTQVLEKVFADLATSATLLAADPVVSAGVVNNPDFYTGYRNQRLNYFAVKGIMARAYLWAGRNQEAHDAAKEVLDQGERWFPWLPYGNIVSNLNPDRIFSPEVLFGIYNPAMYTNYTSFFSPDLTETTVLRAEPDRLKSTFENNENDYRYLTTWLSTSKTYRTFFKFADLLDKTKSWRFLQPMLRKSEMYYILAETDPDPQIAIGYLNQVRHNRGLIDLLPPVNIKNELAKEYEKEFWGEGQLFFYYKRQKQTYVTSGQSIYYTVAPVYAVPLPLSETTPR